MIAYFTQIVIGGCLGYLLATLSESWLHRRVGHATFRSRKKWARLSWIGKRLRKAHFGHAVLHHGKTFRKNHVTQFRSAAEKQSLDAELTDSEHSTFIPLRYGLVTNLIGSVHYVAIPAATCLGLSFLIFARLEIAFLLGASVPIVATPMLSNCVHPYLHLSLKHVNDTAPAIIRLVIRSRYGKWARIQHYVHHRHPQVNFNLLPGGDYLLGTHQKPTADEIDEMQRIGLMDQHELLVP